MFEVGKVLFVISRKTNKVFPVQIVECIIRKTSAGETYSHTVSLPNKDRSEMKLEDIDVDIFTSLGEARDHMMRNATAAITEMIDRAAEVASHAFADSEPHTLPEPDQQALPSVNDDNGFVTQMIDLGNGQKARLRI